MSGWSGKRWLFVVLLIVSTLYLIFNEQGLLKYLGEKDRVDTLRQELKQLQEENKRLESTIDSLRQKIPARIEQTAREDLDLKKPNEVVISTEVR